MRLRKIKDMSLPIFFFLLSVFKNKIDYNIGYNDPLHIRFYRPV